MGGDGGVGVTLPAALDALGCLPRLQINLLGDRQAIAEQIEKHPPEHQQACKNRLSITHTDAGVADTDPPSRALRQARRGKPSSMYRAVELLQQGQVRAVVSGGSTGALVMVSRHLLQTIPGIDKPALMARLPAASGMGLLLDAGANPECDAAMLFQFAVMGAALGQALEGRAAKVGLLNIGEEGYKGTAEVRAAAEMLRHCPGLHFAGFIEANKLFRGEADVVVCNGFAGNVTIKASEGAAEAIQRLLADTKHSSKQSEAADEPGGLQSRIDPAQFNGASLLGLQGSVIKSHGNANRAGFLSAIRQAAREAEQDIPHLISQQLTAMLASSPLASNTLDFNNKSQGH